MEEWNHIPSWKQLSCLSSFTSSRKKIFFLHFLEGIFFDPNCIYLYINTNLRHTWKYVHECTWKCDRSAFSDPPFLKVTQHRPLLAAFDKTNCIFGSIIKLSVICGFNFLVVAVDSYLKEDVIFSRFHVLLQSRLIGQIFVLEPKLTWMFKRGSIKQRKREWQPACGSI